jgi:cell division protein FtsA
MAKKELFYVGLDIGSSKISMVVGKPDTENVLNVIGVGTTYITGLKKGVIQEIEETVSGISEAMEIAERTCGAQIERAVININGSHITCKNSSGAVATGRADQEITLNDVIRAEEAAKAIQVPANREIIHDIPRFFVIDDAEKIKEPIGMTGVRLEVESHILMVSGQIWKNLTKCVNQSGISIEDVIVSPLASAKAVLTKRERELGVAVLDIGAETTGLTVFEEDSILYTKVFPVGASQITNDIAIGLRTTVDVAEKVKIKYGYAFHKDVLEKDKIDLSTIDIKEEGIVSRKHVAEIVEARMEEIFRLVREELRRIKRDTLLPAGIVLTGGGAKLSGIEPLAKECFNLPAVIGKPHSLGGLTEKVYDPIYSNAVGLMLYSFEEMYKKPDAKKGNAINNVLGFFKNFLP